MLVEIPQEHRISTFMEYLKSKSTLMIFVDTRIWNTNTETANLRREDIVLIGLEKTKKELKSIYNKQLSEDKLSDQISMKEYIDPFTVKMVK